MNKFRKKILILGAGEAQLNLIKSSKDLGYYTIVCDMRPEKEGSKIADKYYQQNYMDQDAILEIALKEKINGVISNSEPAMINVSYLVDTLNLPGNSTKSLKQLLSKQSFRKLQKNTGVFSPVSDTGNTIEKILSIAREINFPIIIKPSESSGSRGACKIENYDEEIIKAAFDDCMDFSRNGQVTVEEFIEMQSLEVINVDVFIAGEEMLWDGWYGGLRSSKKPMIPMAKVLPPYMTDEQENKIKDEVGRLLSASGVTLGEFNVETYFTREGQLFIIEINPRQAGDDIPRLIKEHTGVDLTKLLVSLSVDDDHYLKYLRTYIREENCITLQVLFPDKDGIYKGLYIDDAVKPFVCWIDEFVKEGEKVFNARNAEDSVAYVDMEFDNKEQQKYYTDNIEKYIYPIVE